MCFELGRQEQLFARMSAPDDLADDNFGFAVNRGRLDQTSSARDQCSQHRIRLLLRRLVAGIKDLRGA